MYSIYVIEDQTILRELVCRLIENLNGFTLAGSSGDGLAGFNECQKIRPDLVIIDILVPSLNGLEIVRQIKKVLPEAKLIIFSGYSTRERVQAALQAGVNGIVHKDASIEELESAIKHVMVGASFMSTKILEIMRDLMLNPGAFSELDKLTSREKEILQLIAEGNTTKQVAAKLNISIKTADSHRTNVMSKLNIHDIASLTRFAIHEGLIKA